MRYKQDQALSKALVADSSLMPMNIGMIDQHMPTNMKPIIVRICLSNTINFRREKKTLSI
jgi:hypothetical protein